MSPDSILPEPTFDCRNVMSHLEYTIIHEGSQGITEVKAVAQLRSYTKRDFSIWQTFAYKHFWVSDNVTQVRQKSGNPGYLKVIIKYLLYKIEMS